MLAIFLILSALTIYGVSRSKRGSKLPLAVYLLSYGVTTVVGATVISLESGRTLWLAYDAGLDPSLLPEYNSLKYMFLLYSPLIVCPLIFFALSRVKPTGIIREVSALIAGKEIHLYAFIAVWTLSFAYCFSELALNGYLSLENLLAVQGDYVAMINLRTHVFASMGPVFFGLIYMGLPTLTHVAFYRARQTHSLTWNTFFVLSVGLTSILVLFTAQKGPLFVFLGSIMIGYFVLRGLRLWIAFTAVAGAFIMLNAIQIFIFGSWQAIAGLYLIVFRMAGSFPYYVNLYPNTIPYDGPDLGLDILRLAPQPHRAQTVFHYMYPSIGFSGGATPAASHVDAYAQGGIAFALISLIVTACYLHYLSRLGSRINNSAAYALFIGGLVGTYYLTQTTMRDVLLSGYGLIWVFGVLCFLRASSETLWYACRPPLSFVSSSRSS